MKKVRFALAILLCLTLLTACGQIGKTYTAEDMAGKVYTYEKEGFGGPFTISVYEDGSFSYYVGMLSSYIGMGDWSVEDGVLTLTDNTGLSYVNRFQIGEDVLFFLAEGSTGTMYLDMEDGDRFYGAPIPTLPALEELREAILGQNLSAVQDEVLESLQGFTCEDTLEAWGEPDGMCSGLWCNFWDLDETSYISVYYDTDGYISEVRLGLKE